MSAGSSRAGRPSHAKLYGLLALMVFFWSLNFVIGKVALREFPPMLLACVRTSLAGLFILPLYFIRHKRNGNSAPWTRGDIPLLIMLGVFGVALNQIFFVLGLSRTSVAHSAIVIALTPIIVLILAAARRLEHFTSRKLVGMAVALSGVGVLNLSKAAGATLAGDLFILMAAVTFAIFTVFGKQATTSHGSVTVNTFAYAGGAILLSPVTIAAGLGFRFSNVSTTGWLSLVYMAMFPSVVCYLIYYYALTHISASRVSALSYLQPLLATLMAVPILQEPVTVGLVFGGALVLAGVYVTERT